MKRIKSLVDPTQAELSSSGARLIRSREYPGLQLKDMVYSFDPGGGPHAHEKAIFCIVLEGGCTELYGNQVRDYTQFGSEFIPPDHVHTLKFYPPVTRCLSIEIAKPWLQKAQDYGLGWEDALQFRGGALMELLMRVHREFRLGDGASGLAIQGLTNEMLAHVSRLAVNERQQPQWLERIQDFLHAHFSDDLKLCVLADEAGVHPAHLSRQFRKHFGQTIGEYVRRLRVRQSMVELSQSTTSIVRIGLSAGFADQSHFCRVFKTHTGMTPGEFRRTFGADGDIRRSINPVGLCGSDSDDGRFSKV